MLIKLISVIVVQSLIIDQINCQYYSKPYYSRPERQNGGKRETPKSAGDPFLSWHQIDYEDRPNGDEVVYGRPNRPIKQPISRTGSVHDDYERYNNVPMGVTRWRNKLFVTMPRRRTGVPGTLNVLEFDENNMVVNTDLPLRPYPDLATNTLSNRGRVRGSYQIVSVYRTQVDECDRLWVIDNGILEYPGNAQRVQQPAIIIFDLHTNQMIHRYELPSAVTTNSSTFAAITVDVPNPQDCSRTFAYLPDVAGYALIVYDLKQDSSWKFSHNYFHQDPNGGQLQINDLRFEWDDGIFSIALGPRNRRGFRTAYFHAMASTHEYSIDTRSLQNQSNTELSYLGDLFTYLGDKGARQQSATSVLDQETGVLFYSQIQLSGIACWNTNKPFSQENHVVLLQDNQRFIYPSDMTMDANGYLWVMTNTMPFYNYRSLNPQEINFRIWQYDVKDLIRGTNCDNNY